jgi:GT2 family glycosyltransferase
MVIDNYSSDDSLARARQQTYSRIRPEFIDLNHNAGFAAANNIGLKRLQEKGTMTHVLLLNPDACVPTGLFSGLQKIFDERADIGIIGPRLMDAHGRLQPSVRSFPTLGVFVFLFLKLHRVLRKTSVWRRYMRTDFDYEHEQSVDQVMGAAFAIRDRVWQRTDERAAGFLDESFWLWFEEVDYCKRAKEKGWHVWYTPNASVTHRGAVSFNQLVGLNKSWPFLNSALVYARKHLGWISYAVLLVLLPVTVTLSLFSSVHHLYVKWHDQRAHA